MTLSTIISIVSALLGIAKICISYAERQKWMDAGSAAATLKGMQDANEAITRAQAARQLVRSSIAGDPTVLRKHDPFERTGE